MNKTNNNGIMMKNTRLLSSFFSSLFSMMAIVTLSLLIMENANAAKLQSVKYVALPGDKAEITVLFSASISEPNSFSIDVPARVVLDFYGVTNQLDKRTQNINVGATKSVSTVEAGDRTRMVINLSQKVPYTIVHKGNKVIITIDAATRGASSRSIEQGITDIDFRRGENGEARLIISLSEEGANIDVHQEQNNIVVDLVGISLPERFHRRLDVVDFATPVQIIEGEQKGNTTQLRLSTKGKFEHLAYQSGHKLIIEVKPVLVDSKASKSNDPFSYKGDKLSLNFQNIEVRAVLQLLADFTGMNLVTSDTVNGNVTLRLKNVPWDQAMDIILKTKGLAMRQNGNVMLIAPAAEVAAQERQELEAKKQLVELEPLYSEVFEINFAKATELKEILKSNDGASGSAGASIVTGFISDRGSITVDERTNSLLIRDTADQLLEIREILKTLDKPVRQVLIESRIVIASDNFAKDLGVKFGTSAQSNTLGAGISNSLDNLFIDSANKNKVNTQHSPEPALSQGLNIDLPVANPAGTIALALAKLPLGAILELELSAMQQEGNGEIISSPRVITSNQKKAVIEQGTEIPYQEASSSGASTVSFKSATLKLGVTPQITPDDHVIMDIEVNKDEVGGIFNGVPSIDTRSVKTQVLVDNGETVVLGGIYEQRELDGSTRVPFFGDLPYVGFLFKTTTHTDSKSELLIFVTPKIIKDGLQF